MIQKATWIIPGILVTLLLGLLWAMPAFAADAGNIEFLDSDDDEISFISLNGPAGTDGPDEGEEIDGFTVQVEDQDLNEPTAYVGAKAVSVSSGANNLTLNYDWTDLADRNGDGSLNYKDFTAFNANDAEDDDDDVVVPVLRSEIDLDVTNGKLIFTRDSASGATHLEFHLNERMTIGAFVSTHTQTAAAGDPHTPVGDDDAAEQFMQFLAPTNTGTNAGVLPGTGDTWAEVLVDSDGDGSFADEITATVSIDYEVLDTTGTDGLDDAEQGAIANLKVEVMENDDDEPMMVVVSSVGVTVNPVDDAHDHDSDSNADTAPVLQKADIAVSIETNREITLSYKTIYQGMGNESEIGLVTINSSGGVRTSVALKETGSATGKFTTNVAICDSDDKEGCKAGQAVSDTEGENPGSDNPGAVMFPVDAAGDTVIVRYRDAAPRTSRSANISLDTNVPAFSGFTPDSGTAGKDAEPDVSFEVVDGESGIASDDDDVPGSLRIVAALFEADAETDSLIDGPVMLDRDDLNVDEVTDGFSVEARLREGNNVEANELNAGTEDEYEIRWWAVATDVSGNTGVSDSDSDTPCTYSGVALYDGEDLIVGDLLVAVMAADKVGTDDEVNCDPHVIRVDAAAPNLVSAVTGVFFDADEPNDEGTGSLTSIVARFDEALDCDSVTADDFEVGGSAPNDATCKGSNVYLDVDEIDSNDTPDVSVAEEAVGDRAGNLIGEDAEVESEDGIPAGISVTVVGTASGDRPVTDSTITITVSSDEKLSGRPMVQIRKVGNNYALGDSDFGGTADPTGNTNEWEFEEDLDDAGLYNVYVTAEDRVNSGDSMAGLQPGVLEDLDDDPKTAKTASTTDFTLDADDLKDDKIILFEVDNAVSTPTYDPEDDGETDNANIFIRVNFENEGNEYGLVAKCTDAEGVEEAPNADGKCDKDSTESKTGASTDTPGSVATDFDTQSTITVVSAEFNGVDVMDDLITRDWILYVYRPGDLTDGDHKLELEVEDSAGNEEEFTLEFAKVARKPYSLPINPGPNLVSFPANPTDGDVNAVFGGEGNEDITRVLTFDNASGLWMAATKGADGMFVGELTTIDAMHGYWVVSDGVLSVSAVLEGGDRFDRPPPHIAVQKGWNLVPVADTAQSEAGTMIATSDYFANIDAEVLYGYNSFAARLDRLSTAKAAEGEDQDNVVTGAAYWVYANEAGIIIP